MDGCLAFYYSNSKKALKNTDEFHRTIPPNALILVAAVVRCDLFYFLSLIS
jgi:hypothetical protein